MAKNVKSTIKSIPASFWLSLLFFILVCSTILVGTFNVYQSMMQEKTQPVSSLVIKGINPYTKDSEIVKAIKKGELNNFFKLDVNQVQNNLENLPWVYSASVRKHWPDEIDVYVVDQVPIAQWNDDFFINQYGVIFQADKTRVTEPLPKLFGPEGSEALALENYRNMSNLLTYVKLDITELVLTERHAWQLTLEDGVFIYLGREDRIKRVQRFMDAYKQIKAYAKKDMQVDYIDLRYDTGMAVGWKSLVDDQEKEQKTNV